MKALLVWMALFGTGLGWVERERHFARERDTFVWEGNALIHRFKFSFSGDTPATWQGYFFEDYEVSVFLFEDREIPPDLRAEIQRLYPSATIQLGVPLSNECSTFTYTSTSP
jgi:hypothetical protein